MRELPKKRRCHTNPVCLTILWVNFLFKWRISRVTLQSKDCIALLALKCVKFDLLYVAENIAKNSLGVLIVTFSLYHYPMKEQQCPWMFACLILLIIRIQMGVFYA